MIDIRIIIAGVALAGAFGAGWYVADLRGDSALATLRSKHSDALAANTATTLAAQRALDGKRDQLAQTIAKIDHDESQALKKANDETERLRRCIADGTCGLRVRAVCPKSAAIVPGAAASAGVGDGAGTGLDRVAEQDYFNLRSAIITKERQLSACQRILRGERAE